jgi:predicted pyridoxine 5'-phosphate oxidase superfamily flavin-nucleotide-binding protein
MEQAGGWATDLSADLADFIAGQRSFFLATANAEGQPYIQHRGGPRGFLHVLDARTLAFADVAGNRQYISVGNLEDNAKVHLFLIDYANRQRIKVWGTAKVIEDDPALLKRLTVAGGGKPERAIIIQVTAWDANCPQHIPLMLEAEDVQAALATRDRRIAELEAQLAAKDQVGHRPR